MTDASDLSPPQPTAVSPALPADAVEVGRVVGAWGIKGAIKVAPSSIARRRRAACQRASAVASSARELIPATSSSLDAVMTAQARPSAIAVVLTP